MSKYKLTTEIEGNKVVLKNLSLEKYVAIRCQDIMKEKNLKRGDLLDKNNSLYQTKLTRLFKANREISLTTIIEFCEAAKCSTTDVLPL